MADALAWVLFRFGDVILFDVPWIDVLFGLSIFCGLLAATIQFTSFYLYLLFVIPFPFGIIEFFLH